MINENIIIYLDADKKLQGNENNHLFINNYKIKDNPYLYIDENMCLKLKDKSCELVLYDDEDYEYCKNKINEKQKREYHLLYKESNKIFTPIKLYDKDIKSIHPLLYNKKENLIVNLYQVMFIHYNWDNSISDITVSILYTIISNIPKLPDNFIKEDENKNKEYRYIEDIVFDPNKYGILEQKISGFEYFIEKYK